MTHIHQSEKNWTAIKAQMAASPVHFIGALHG
jgi:hypothetical protein